MTCILLGELKKNSCNCYTASSVEADVDQLWCTVICFILCVYLRVTRWFSGSLTFHPATVSPFALYFPPPVLHCLSLGRGKCQCTHLSIGRADPFRPGLHHMIKPGGGNQSGWASDTCSWQVIQAWRTWDMKPSGFGPRLANPGHTCWACKKTTLEQ